MKLDLKLKLATLLESPNIAEYIKGEVLGKLGHNLLTLVGMDLSGRSEWDTMMADSLKFIMQIVEPKNTPFSGASNVKFPLMTVAALNANRRVLKSMKVPNIDEVLPDPKGPNAMPPPPPDPRIVAGELRAKTTILRVKVQAELKAHQLMQSAEKNRAQIALMAAQVVKTLAEAEATGDRTSLDALTLRMNALRDANEQVVKTAELIHELANGMDEGEEGDGGIRPAIELAGLGALAGEPDNPIAEGISESSDYGPPGVPLRGRGLSLEGGI